MSVSRPITKAESQGRQRPMWLGNERGQLVMEYMLLLLIGIAVAAFLTTAMVSRNPDSPGFIVHKWFSITKVIGEDPADDVVLPNE